MLIALVAAGPAVDPEELGRRRNLGKAFFENPTTHPQAVAEFKKALALAPGSARERLNVGLALLANGQTPEGIAEIEKVQKQDPSIPHTWFNLGVQYKRAGEYERSQKQFEKFLEMVPQEPVAHYNLGTLHKLANRTPEAIASFERAMALDPNLAAPHFQLYNLYRQAGRRDDAAKQLQLFQKAKDQNANAAVPEDMEWSFYSEVLDPVEAQTGVADPTPPRDWKFAPRRVAGAAKGEGGGLLVMDVQGDGRPDLVFWSGGALQALAGAAPETIAQGVEFAAVGDANNDGFADLAVITAEGPALLMNTRGRFTRKPLPAPPGHYRVAAWLDYDHDYDLDLLLLGDRNVLLRNQGESGFVDRSADFPFVKGDATGAVAFRLVADSKGFDFAVSYRDRATVLYQDNLAGVYKARDLVQIPAGAKLMDAVDVDHSGSMDLVYEAGGGAWVAYNLGAFNDGRNLKFESARVGDGPVVFGDWENRGVSDAVVGGKRLRQESERRWSETKPVQGLPAARAYAVEDFNGDGRADLAVLGSDGAVQLLTNQTVSPNAWLRAGVAGVKNLKLAYGSEVEVKAGSRYRKQIYRGYPLTFGMRAVKQADAVRITWPNGLIQNEANQLALRPLVFKEAQRLSGSCPQVWTWNGVDFEYVTDVLGVAPLGASAGDGTYFPVDHREYVQLPAMQLRNGAYEVRLTEELSEVAYIDQAELLVVDHPASSEIFLNEKFQSPPYPDLRIYQTGERRAPAARREVSLGNGWRATELEFASMPEKPLLVIHGWVDWADGSVFRGRSQEKGRELAMPSLEAMGSDGRWRTLLADMGMPAGKPKWIAVELPEPARRLRIKSNLALHWDEAFLTQADASAPRAVTLRASSADLRFRGFSRVRLDPERKRPEMFFYAGASPVSMWNPTPGMYTRYGDTAALLGSADDRFVIMGSGDELALRFDARGLLPLGPGMRRSFVLGIDGWAKDRDPNTAFSQTVVPLPFHGMSQYPYGAGEAFPESEAHRAWMREYNTRPALQLIRRLSGVR
ncbi:MAG: FG-GAP-like repeat-containing protein [Bryobacteraceae bacterium]